MKQKIKTGTLHNSHSASKYYLETTLKLQLSSPPPPEAAEQRMGSKIDESTKEGEITGSWSPTILVIIAFLLKWLISSPSNTAVGMRRFLQMKKLQLKKQFGFRDESKYKMGAGDGANQKHKRQG